MKTGLLYRFLIFICFLVLWYMVLDVVLKSPKHYFLDVFTTRSHMIALLFCPLTFLMFIFTFFQQFECTNDALIIRNWVLGTKKIIPLKNIKQINKVYKRIYNDDIQSKPGFGINTFLQMEYNTANPGEEPKFETKEWKTTFIEGFNKFFVYLQEKVAKNQ